MESNNEKLYLLGGEKVSKALLKLGIPTMMGMMTSALYNLVDSYFVGKLGTSQIGAVSIVYPISIIILGIGLLFGSGASSYLARLLGDRRYEEADCCASTAVAVSMIIAVIIIGGLLVFINPLLKLLGATESIFPYAKEYAVPFIFGLIFNVFNITINNIITAEGASMYSMLAMLAGGCMNIILDPICIFKLGMGVSGAAVATLISRCISTGMYIYYIKSGKSNFHFSLKNCKFQKKILAEIFKIGIPMLAYQLLCSVALAITNTQAAVYGDSAIAAFGIVNRIVSLGAMMLMGFLKGFQPFVGYNYGAGNNVRVKEATKTALLWTSVFCVAAALIMIFGRRILIQVFSNNDAEVLQIGAKSLVVNAITFMTMGYQTVFSFQFMGLGKAKEGGMISMGRQGVFFIPIIFILAYTMGLNGVILAQPIADICSLILVLLLVHKNNSTAVEAA